MPFPPHSFRLDDASFTIRFETEGAHSVAVLIAHEPRFDLLTACLTTLWKLQPVLLLESLADHRPVTFGEFYTILYGEDIDDRPNGAASMVLVHDGEQEISLREDFFSAIVRELARTHIGLVGEENLPWVQRLSPAARSRWD